MDRVCTCYNETETVSFCKIDIIGKIILYIEPYIDQRVQRKNYTGKIPGLFLCIFADPQNLMTADPGLTLPN